MQIETTDQIHPNKIRQVLLLAILVGLGYVLYKEMYFMLGAFLGAVALYMLMRRPMFKMVFEWKMRKWCAALILIIVSLIVIVLPFTLIINVLIDKLGPLIQNPGRIQTSVLEISGYLQTKFKIDLLSKANLEKLPPIATQVGTTILGSTLNMVLNTVIMYFILWFMLMKGGDMERSLRQNLPFKFTNTNKLIQETRAMVVSNAIGIPVLGIIQGILAAVGYYLFDVEEPVLWGIMTGIASVVPFVGTTLIWLPIAVLAFAKADNANGWWLLAWGAIVIGSSDNVIRFVLQKYMADIHPLVTVFGVIVGLNLFGFFGLIFGPLLVSLFLLLVRIYNDEFISERPVETVTDTGSKDTNETS
jgi:predicted PurR-regulated permease PerM